MMRASESEILAEIRVAGIRVQRARDDYEQAIRYEQRMKDTLDAMNREVAS